MDKFLSVLKWIAVILVAVLLGWTAYMFKLNIGGIISMITGEKKKRKTAILNSSGQQVGSVVPIMVSKNPMRDKTKVDLENGTSIQLPKGMKDTDVKHIIKIDINNYEVEAQHETLTDVFDSD